MNAIQALTVCGGRTAWKTWELSVAHKSKGELRMYSSDLLKKKIRFWFPFTKNYWKIILKRKIPLTAWLMTPDLWPQSNHRFFPTNLKRISDETQNTRHVIPIHLWFVHLMPIAYGIIRELNPIHNTHMWYQNLSVLSVVTFNWPRRGFDGLRSRLRVTIYARGNATKCEEKEGKDFLHINCCHFCRCLTCKHPIVIF